MEFEKIENYLRKGDTIFEDYEEAASIDSQELSDTPDIESEETVTNQTTIVPNDDHQMEVEDVFYNEEEVNTLGLDSTLPQSSRFSKLQIKEKFKTKGRPKRKKKQLTFNKTAADRKLERNVGSKNKNPKKIAKKSDFIDDKSDSEDDESLESEEEHESEDAEEELEEEDEDDDSFEEEEDDSCVKVTFNNAEIV